MAAAVGPGFPSLLPMLITKPLLRMLQVELEDDNTAVPRSHIDDEYAHAGERDPKILITTSRDPSSRCALAWGQPRHAWGPALLC